MPGTWHSRAPDAIDALVAIMKPVVAGTPVTIHDGPWTEGSKAEQVLAIGWNGFFSAYLFPRTSQTEEFGTAAVTGTSVQEGLGAGIRETFAITCASLVRAGNPQNMSTARKTCFNNAALVGSNLGPPWLGGTVMRAVMASNSQLDYAQDRRGLLVFLTFHIECEAFSRQ